MAKLRPGHDSGTHKTHTYTHTHGQGKLYMPYSHFMAGGIKIKMSSAAIATLRVSYFFFYTVLVIMYCEQLFDD